MSNDKDSSKTVEDYLASLPPSRREAIEVVRNLIRENLPPGFEEGIQYGMIGYYVPLSRFPKTYNEQPLGLAAIASQKNYMSLYLMGVYCDPNLRSWFENGFRASGKKLDMGKSCVRFRALEDLPLEVIGKTIARVQVDDLIAFHEASHSVKSAKNDTKGAKKKEAR